MFHTFNYGNERATANYGVCVRGEVDFYGVLQDIIEVQYPGMLGLRCVLFKCDWFDPTPGRGVRENKYGVDVNQSRRYNKFEPFILASQAEQVTFVPYPRVRTSGITWLSVVKVSPRGTIVGDQDVIPPMQQDHCSVIAEAEENTSGSIFLVDPQNPYRVNVVDDTSGDEDDEEETVPDEFSESDEPDDDDEISEPNDSDEY